MRGEQDRILYVHERQYFNVGELSDSIQIIWNNLSNSYIKNVYISFPRRLVSVIWENDRNVDYWCVKLWSTGFVLQFCIAY